MTHYSDAFEWMDLAEIALSKGMFRKSVYHSCMAIELFLKHVAVRHVFDDQFLISLYPSPKVVTASTCTD